ncbi:hypothetical protein ASC95_17000 [Pelomonas sp. Root1217]|uniref:hypothetical protein n=1 Tax=Pelomonas sp. Root1217 TaxID=1736430 RepID=UPI00070C89A2|nr:hypothetical protein [Pelomonas sp. Root1217]KQV49306.1 hypothetical protein ASC95_17000 [Pelomonas sp. Root1217]
MNIDVSQAVRSSWLLAALVGLLLCTPALADPVPVVHFEHEDVDKFGDLSQKNVAPCPNMACGPVAAVNSFVFLQREYSLIYGSKLIPAVDGTKPTQAELIAVAADLAKNYMDTCCEKGTHITNFINGKQKYFDTVAPNTTVIHGQVKDWDPVEGGAKPDNIDETNPTPQFLLNELSHNQDIELLLDFGTDGGHYVTLTSLFWSDDDGDGSIDAGEAANIGYIDPEDGKSTSARLGELAGALTVQYLSPVTGNVRSGTIFAAIAESPEHRTNPEPASAALVLAALAAVWCVRRRSAAARPRDDYQLA